MPPAGDQSSGSPAFTEVATNRSNLTFARSCRLLRPFVILNSGGPALVRRRIQTPSDATVLSVVQPEGEVVLGASPPARRFCRAEAASRLGGIRPHRFRIIARRAPGVSSDVCARQLSWSADGISTPPR